MDEITQAPRFRSLILLKLSCRSHVVLTLLRREDIRLTQGKAMLSGEPEKPLKVHGLRQGLGQIGVAVAKGEKPIQILKRHPGTTCCVPPFKSASVQVGEVGCC